MTDQPVAEEILLESFDPTAETEPSPAAREFTHILKQRLRHKSQTAQFGLTRDHKLAVRYRDLRGDHSFDINLFLLDPVAEIELNISWFWYHLAAISTTLFAIFVLLTTTGYHPLSSAVAIWITSGTGATSVISFLSLWHRSSRRIVFKTIHGGIPLIRMVPKLPNKAEFTEFMDTLNVMLNQAHARANARPQRMLADGLRNYRQLRNQGAISATTYDEIKAEIMAAF